MAFVGMVLRFYCWLQTNSFMVGLSWLCALSLLAECEIPRVDADSQAMRGGYREVF